MHFMIDLETLGTDPVTAPIIQIAVVPFKIEDDGPFGEGFQAFVSAASNELPPFNRRASADTIRWWVETNPALLAKIMQPTHGVSLGAALIDLRSYVYGLGLDVDGVWGNGPTFDISMLESAYQQFDSKPPWGFRAVRCCRTIFAIAGDDPDVWEGGAKTERELLGEKHDALVDCDRQIRWVQQTFAKKIAA